MKKNLYCFIGIIVWSLAMLFCSGCGNRAASEAGINQETGKEEETMGDLMILSKEQAREVIECYLQEKYGGTYQVSLPCVTEDGNYAAEALMEGNPDNRIQVKVQSASGVCRDSRCAQIVENNVRENLEKAISGIWDKYKFQLFCSLSTGVSRQDWNLDASPEDILQQEEVQCQLYLLIQEEQSEKEKQADLLKQLLDLDCLKNMHLNLDVYYVTDRVFNAACEEINEGKSMPDTSCDSDFINFVNVNWYTRFEIEPEEIINGFTR